MACLATTADPTPFATILFPLCSTPRKKKVIVINKVFLNFEKCLSLTLYAAMVSVSHPPVISKAWFQAQQKDNSRLHQNKFITLSVNTTKLV